MATSSRPKSSSSARTARVMGNIQSPRLIVEEGAIIEGSCSMIKAREVQEEAAVAVASHYTEPAAVTTYSDATTTEEEDEDKSASYLSDDADEDEDEETVMRPLYKDPFFLMFCKAGRARLFVCLLGGTDYIIAVPHFVRTKITGGN